MHACACVCVCLCVRLGVGVSVCACVYRRLYEEKRSELHRIAPVVFLKIISQKREPKRIVGKGVHNNVYFCESIAVNSSISICYDAVWLMFKYKELRKFRNKVINIVVFMFVECFT